VSLWDPALVVSHDILMHLAPVLKVGCFVACFVPFMTHAQIVKLEVKWCVDLSPGVVEVEGFGRRSWL
jgi:hypothetical protein